MTIFFQFVQVLNSKKAKLRELRDRISKSGTTGHQSPEEEEQSTDRTESFDEASDEDAEKNIDDVTSKGVSAATSSRGRKRK